MGWGDFLPVIGDVIGGVIDQKQGNHYRNQQDQTNQFNYDMQKEFAQNSIRWKVQDAIAAGLHPLAALGASGYSASPSHITSPPDSSMGNMARSLGQNLGRAVSSVMTEAEREMVNLNLERARTQNEILKENLNALKRTNTQGLGPPLPGGAEFSGDPHLQGQGDLPKAQGRDPRVIDEPFRRPFSDPSNPAKEAGAIQDYQLVRTGNGYAVAPGRDVKQRIEDDWIAEQQWKVRAYSAVMSGLIRLPNGERAIPNPMSGELIPMSFFERQGKKFKRTIMNDLKKYMRGPIRR